MSYRQQLSSFTNEELANLIEGSNESVIEPQDSGWDSSRDWKVDPNTSKAISSAMLALQDRCRIVEDENLSLTRTVSDIQGKYNSELEKWNSRFQQITTQTNSLFQGLLERKENLSEKLQELKSDTRKQEGEAELLQMRLNSAEEQKKQMDEQQATDRKTWDLKYDKLKSEVDSKFKNYAIATEKLAIVEKENQNIRDRIKAQRQLGKTLQTELTEVKTTSESSQHSMKVNLRQIKVELQRVGDEHSRKLKLSQKKTQQLKDQVEENSIEIEQLQKLLDDVHHAAIIDDQLAKAEPVRKRKTKRRATSRSPMKDTMYTKTRSPMKDKLYTKTRSPVKDFYGKTEKDFTREIESLDATLSNYRAIYGKLISTQTPPDVAQIQEVSKKIEEENSKLMRVKMEYQEYLKSS